MVKQVLLSLIAISLVFSSSCQQDPFTVKREKMVREQLVAKGITDSVVLAAMGKVQRHLFVPEQFRSYAYIDGPLNIGYNQTISQPFIVAYMTELMQLEPDDVVLEIGTGSGYQAAILGEIVHQVYTIEILEELGYSALNLLEKLNYDNVEVRIGDGYNGWPEHAPFDAIIVTAAPGDVPQPLLEQLKEGGRMVIPVGPRSMLQDLILIEKINGEIVTHKLMAVRFVPFVRR